MSSHSSSTLYVMPDLIGNPPPGRECSPRHLQPRSAAISVPRVHLLDLQPVFAAFFRPRVQELDLQPAFPAISGPRVQEMDLQPVFPDIFVPRVQELDLQPKESSTDSINNL